MPLCLQFERHTGNEHDEQRIGRVDGLCEAECKSWAKPFTSYAPGWVQTGDDRFFGQYGNCSIYAYEQPRCAGRTSTLSGLRESDLGWCTGLPFVARSIMFTCDRGV